MKRVLFDEDVPRPLRRELPGFDIQTVVEAGWSGVRNGTLLRLADQSFDVFLTADRNLPYQQNLGTLRMGVLVLAVRSTRLADLRPLTTTIREAIEAVPSGGLLLVTPPDPSIR